MKTKKKLQVCGNIEWIRENVLQDYREVLSDCGENFEIDYYTKKLMDNLSDCGFQLLWRGSENYHAWNGAMCFSFKSGIVGCRETLTKPEMDLISECQDNAMESFDNFMSDLQQYEGGEV